jgi:Mor family transcriptional regulator
MGCKKSRRLPSELIERIQEYVDGETVYIPKKVNRNPDGTNPSPLDDRNAEIYEKYMGGKSVKELSSEYYISTQGIYKILTKFK